MMSEHYQEDERASLRPLSRPARADVAEARDCVCDFGQLLKDILVAIGWSQPTTPPPTIEDLIAQRRNAVWFYDRRFGFREREQEEESTDDDSVSDADSDETTPASGAGAGAETEAESTALDPSGKGMYI